MFRLLKKRKIVSFILLLFCLQVSAPSWKSLSIYEVPAIQPYEKLLFAIGMIETQCNNLAYNPREEAAGCLQIRPIRLIEYNRQTGSSYLRSDLYDYAVSRKIFLYFAEQIGPYDFEQIARRWNGSGHQTTAYWNRIRQLL